MFSNTLQILYDAYVVEGHIKAHFIAILYI